MAAVALYGEFYSGVHYCANWFDFFGYLVSGNMADGILFFCDTVYEKESRSAEKSYAMFAISINGLYNICCYITFNKWNARQYLAFEMMRGGTK